MFKNKTKKKVKQWIDYIPLLWINFFTVNWLKKHLWSYCSSRHWEGGGIGDEKIYSLPFRSSHSQKIIPKQLTSRCCVVVGLRKNLWPSDHNKPKAYLWNKILLEHSHTHYIRPQAASVPRRQIWVVVTEHLLPPKLKIFIGLALLKQVFQPIVSGIIAFISLN